jgi:colanic acid/amylovoran biosynthesis glycosyltransferase
MVQWMANGLPPEVKDMTAPSRRATHAGGRRARQYRLAYFVSRFPTTTETFVVRELNAVAARPGIEADLFALFPTPKGVVQESARRWVGEVHRPRPLSCLAHLARWTLRRPLRTTSTLALIVKDHAANPGVLIRALVAFGGATIHARTLETLETDHVHAHFASYPALAAWICHRLTGIPYSFTAHAHDLYVQPLGVPRRAAEAAFVVSISEFNQRLLRELAPSSAPIHIVHCGVDTDRYRFASHEPSPTGPVRALCVASLCERKGHRVLFEALARGGPQLERIELDLVGDGHLRHELEATAERLGLGARVRFHGDLTEQAVATMLDQADVFVLPSIIERNGNTEGIPVALMEAMAAGLPVVTSRLTGIPELVREGGTGLLADPGDVRSLARKLSELLADPEAGTIRAESARALVEREFSLESSAARLLTLFTGERAASAPPSEPTRPEPVLTADA